jgi:hypothetical protein
MVVIAAASFCVAEAQSPASSRMAPGVAESVASVAPTSQPSNPATSDITAAPQTQNWYVRPDSKTRFKRYVNSMFGPVALGKTVASAGWGTWRNSPEEWGDQWEGFGRRVASGLGKSVIKNTTIYGLGEALKYDSRFYRSQKKDFGSRLGNALISPVTARDKNGKRVIGIPRIVGTYTSSIVAAETWYPDRYSYKNGLRSGTISLGFTAAFNVFKEFVWK